MPRAAISPAQELRTTRQLFIATTAKATNEVAAAVADAEQAIVTLEVLTADLDVAAIDATLADHEARLEALEP